MFLIFRKKMVRYNLIKYQSFTQNIDGTNIAGMLIHLPRFYAQFKPRHVIIMEKITDILKSKPNCMAEYHEVKSHFEENHQQRCLTRMFKSPFFHKFVITDTVSDKFTIFMLFVGMENVKIESEIILNIESAISCDLSECN